MTIAVEKRCQGSNREKRQRQHSHHHQHYSEQRLLVGRSRVEVSRGVELQVRGATCSNLMSSTNPLARSEKSRMYLSCRAHHEVTPRAIFRNFGVSRNAIAQEPMSARCGMQLLEQMYDLVNILRATYSHASSRPAKRYDLMWYKIQDSTSATETCADSPQVPTPAPRLATPSI